MYHNHHLRNLPDAEVQSDVSAGRNLEKTGRRIVEFGALLSNLRTYKQCRLGPVPLTADMLCTVWLYTPCNGASFFDVGDADSKHRLFVYSI